MALGWHAATGGMAVANKIAVGGLAVAEEANNELAKAYVADSLFFGWSDATNTFWFWLVFVAILLVPMVAAHRLVRPTEVTRPSPS